MSDASPLLVPITCEALVVNDLVRTGERWLRLTMAYADLTNPPGTATPRDPSQADPLFTAQPGTDVAPGITSSQFYNGVYLKWRLPPALLRGVVDNRTGETRFPPIPNRWLVVRLGGVDPANRTAAAWIIESDFVNPQGFAATTSSGRSAPYVVGGDADPTSIAIGRNVALGAWTEPGTSLRLTAMAPGNPAFAWSQPSCNNVLSFIDPLGARRGSRSAPELPRRRVVLGSGRRSAGRRQGLRPSPARPRLAARRRRRSHRYCELEPLGRRGDHGGLDLRRGRRWGARGTGRDRGRALVGRGADRADRRPGRR
jgi:hypothetical protein